ncbi:MAG: hypothetical protein JOS17DRAFT_781621 [Linnemannia elongata]|nr:MAG: hypothetical protein JOS17DRAFT_781621 [Linnemannia elongata]
MIGSQSGRRQHHFYQKRQEAWNNDNRALEELGLWIHKVTELRCCLLIDTAKEFATIPGFEEHPCNSILEKYLPGLKTERNVEKFRRLLVVERGKLNEPTVDPDALPEELKPSFGSSIPSKYDCLSVWKSDFDTIILNISNHTNGHKCTVQALAGYFSSAFQDTGDRSFLVVPLCVALCRYDLMRALSGTSSRTRTTYP